MYLDSSGLQTVIDVTNWKKKNYDKLKKKKVVSLADFNFNFNIADATGSFCRVLKFRSPLLLNVHTLGVQPLVLV